MTIVHRGDDVHVEIAKDDLSTTRLIDDGVVPLNPGQARVVVDAFGLSTNNITYAHFGEAMKYWDFFPSTGEDASRWGRLPVWGFGEVVESTNAELAAGVRLFGYFPMGDQLIITPFVTSVGVVDTSAHRAHLASAYNSFRICASDPLYRADREDLQMLLYPLFFTSFLIDDFLADDGALVGADVAVSSASSNTAIGLAFMARRRGARVVGITSHKNLEFTSSLAIYDDVVTYDDVASLPRRDAVYVDMAGDPAVRLAVHEHFGDELLLSLVVGGTHFGAPTPSPTSRPPGPRPTFFFAPDRVSARTKQWGADELNARVAVAWHDFATFSDSWILRRDVRGAEKITKVYESLLRGDVDPAEGFVCSLREGESGS